MTVFITVLSVAFLALTQTLMIRLTHESWNYPQLSWVTFFVCTVLSLFIKRQKISFKSFEVSFYFCLALLCFFKLYIQNTSLAMILIFTFPIFLIFYSLIKERKYASWTVFFIGLQTLLGLIILHGQAYVFLGMQQIVLGLVSSIFMTIFYLRTSAVIKQNHFSFFGFFLNSTLLSFCFILFEKQIIFPSQILIKEVFILSVSIPIGIWGAFYVFFRYLQTWESIDMAFAYFLLPFFHLVFYQIFYSHFPLSSKDLIGSLAVCAGPILYYVGLSTEKKALMLGAKLD